MNVYDYRVDAQTVEQIESRTEFYRQKWGIANQLRFSVYDLLFKNMPYDLKESGLKLVGRPRGFMGERDAYARSKPRRIFYRDNLLAQLKFGDPRISITFLHELGHILMHPGAPKAWMTGGGQSYAYIETERSAEWQATMFALCIKAPTRLSTDCDNAQQIAARFLLGEKDAEKRFENIRLRRPRKLPIQPVASLNSDARETESFTYQCPVCGAQKLQGLGPKNFCDTCGVYSDKFQDGDRLGFEF